MLAPETLGVFSSAYMVRLWCGAEPRNIRPLTRIHLLDDLARDSGVHLLSTWTSDITENASLTEPYDYIGSCCGTGLGMKTLTLPGQGAVTPEPSAGAPRLEAAEPRAC